MNRLVSRLRDLMTHPLWNNWMRVQQNLPQYQPLEEGRTMRGLLPLLFVALLLWNWRIAAAILAGSFTMNALFLAHSDSWQQRFKQVQQFLTPQNIPVVLAATGGLTVTVGTYTSLSMWAQAGDRWLAIGAILQGIVSCGILALLSWQAWKNQHLYAEQQLEELLKDMASVESMQRFLAVKRVHRHLQDNLASAEQRQTARAYMKLVLERESVPLVREALLNALQVAG